MARYIRGPYNGKPYLNTIRSQEELGYNDMTTYCESVFGSCEECPCFLTFCNGDRKSIRCCFYLENLTFFLIVRIFSPPRKLYFTSSMVCLTMCIPSPPIGRLFGSSVMSGALRLVGS